ncbi:F-box domain, cyclin-like protein [Tanacetum coccineum]
MYRSTMDSSTSSQSNQPYSPLNRVNLDMDFEQLMYSQDYYAVQGSMSLVKANKPLKRASKVKKNDNKEPSKEWTPAEEITLCKSWCDVSKNSEKGNAMKNEVETLKMHFSLKCVSRTLQSTVNNYLFSSSSLDLSAFSMDSHTVNGITRRCGNYKKIKLDCLRLDELFLRRFLKVYVEELILLKASSLHYDFLSDIAYFDPNLRVLRVELSDNKRSIGFNNKLNSLLMRCCLESMEIKVRMRNKSENGHTIPRLCHKLPQTIKVLKLDMRVLLAPIIFVPTLTHISLVLNLITNVTVRTIVQSCPLLAELELIDIQISNPFDSEELSHEGIHWFLVLDLFGCDLVADSCLSSISCHTLLTSLNLGGTNVTDAGMVVLELCIGNCILVTDEAMKVLAVRGRLQDESKLLRRLDIFNCPGISANYIEYLKKPFFSWFTMDWDWRNSFDSYRRCWVRYYSRKTMVVYLQRWL